MVLQSLGELVDALIVGGLAVRLVLVVLTAALGVLAIHIHLNYEIFV